jgi:uncharacterized protein YbjQ (UPF0145 family)
MITTTLSSIAGKRPVRELGIVTGNTIRAKHIGKDIMAGLKQLAGGELTGYTEMMNEAREQAMARMIAQAEALGANAILGIRFSTANVMSMAAEVMVYGTAVVI